MKTLINKTVLTLTAFMSVNAAFANSLPPLPEKAVAKTSENQTKETIKDKDIKWWAHNDTNCHPVPDAGLSNNAFYSSNSTETTSTTEKKNTDTAKNAVANTLPPTPDYLANSLTPTPLGKHICLRQYSQSQRVNMG